MTLYQTQDDLMHSGLYMEERLKPSSNGYLHVFLASLTDVIRLPADKIARLIATARSASPILHPSNQPAIYFLPCLFLQLSIPASNSLLVTPSRTNCIVTPRLSVSRLRFSSSKNSMSAYGKPVDLCSLAK